MRPAGLWAAWVQALQQQQQQQQQLMRQHSTMSVTVFAAQLPAWSTECSAISSCEVTCA
jgi:hypothetical protein